MANNKPTNDQGKGHGKDGQHLGNHLENGIIMSSIAPPRQTPPIEEIRASTGWGRDELSDDEVSSEGLKQQGIHWRRTLKHWKKNGELCKLDIINPDITIEDRPLKHVTPAMEDLFRKHVDSLLKIGAIRRSKSRHRTMANG
ncbi:hypothetical protein Tco_1438879 [Tanacetum coccineum]